MDHAKRGVAVLHGIHNDTNRKQIIDLVYGFILVLHLLVNTKKVLDASVDLRFDTRISDMHADLVHNSLNITLPLALSDGNFIHQIIISLGL